MLILISCVILYVVIGLLISVFYIRWTVDRNIYGPYKNTVVDVIYTAALLPITIIVFLIQYLEYGEFPKRIVKWMNKDD